MEAEWCVVLLVVLSNGEIWRCGIPSHKFVAEITLFCSRFGILHG